MINSPGTCVCSICISYTNSPILDLDIHRDKFRVIWTNPLEAEMGTMDVTNRTNEIGPRFRISPRTDVLDRRWIVLVTVSFRHAVPSLLL